MVAAILKSERLQLQATGQQPKAESHAWDEEP
jgi:hypothetical protein